MRAPWLMAGAQVIGNKYVPGVSCGKQQIEKRYQAWGF
jgi:hypothetical protein